MNNAARIAVHLLNKLLLKMIPSWLNVAQKALFYGNLEECGTKIGK